MAIALSFLDRATGRGVLQALARPTLIPSERPKERDEKPHNAASRSAFPRGLKGISDYGNYER